MTKHCLPAQEKVFSEAQLNKELARIQKQMRDKQRKVTGAVNRRKKSKNFEVKNAGLILNRNSPQTVPKNIQIHIKLGTSMLKGKDHHFKELESSCV